VAAVDDIQRELIALARELGQEARQLALLGEGNVSATCHDGTFWIKASGSSLATLDEVGVSRVRLEPILELLRRDHLDEQEIEAALLAARVDEAHKKPSVETFFHAICLSEGGASWVGHVHPLSANRILCSRLGAKPFLGHLFPDAVVVCGKAPAVVPYVDPGFALAKAIRVELRRYQDVYGEPPKLLLLENHGVTALGNSAKEVMNILLMADKWARILWGSYALGGPVYLPTADVERIDRRLDERHRRRALVREGGADG
jgi:rhamnose utilization protein RhaD (predicted bifunctional aldolase and dehydrogenase)